ncbi:uncharacterized protein LOC114528243 [Dendronephthya gigantea]|uniref:uncharacterized protein LOC114528243 n=1 Tax=Dendronephthya gigantea TaxID=151771 RepID=UPI0010693AD2|nr:uncharacterized protein LOC114528243 [Dendronephthya gigantea]
MDFKVERVSKVKAPSNLLSFSNNTEQRNNNDKGSQPQVKQTSQKPKVPDKPRADSKPDKGETGSDQNQNKPSVYAYAGVEFRPLQVTVEGAFSTAIIEGRKPNSSKPVDNQKRELLAYEEVTIPSGDFDRINTENILVKSQDSSGTNSALSAFTADMQNSSSEVSSDAYAEVDTSAFKTRKKPPPMPKPYAKAKDSVDGTDRGKRKPPPIPRPYGARKDDHDEPSQPSDEAAVPQPVDAVYAVVNKLPKSPNLIDLSEPDKEKDEVPPPLPSRPNFEAEELRKSQEDLLKDDYQQEKSQGKGSSIMKTIKKHIRQKSDGGPAKKYADESKDAQVKKSASTEALDEEPSTPIRAYLVTDIVGQPSTKMFGEPEMYDSVTTDSREEENVSKGSTGLPDGWQEVKDLHGTYYWHVATGNIQREKPKILETVTSTDGPVQRPEVEKPRPELKTVISFPVHSMGWLELEESQVAPHNMSDTIAECISNLARDRKDLWKTTETWGGGKDLRLLLEGDNLKLVDCQTKAILLVQPISKMRVWGAGRDEQKDFAYVARDQTTGKHKCHVFRCHGNISGRAIHNKLHEMCSKILAEKRRARENQQNGSTKQWSDILNTPPKPSQKDQAGFNVKPVTESKKSFSGKFIGKVEVPRPTGIDVVHKAIDVAITSTNPHTWRTCLIEITVSSVRSTDCLSQEVIAENRIKFVSFIGVAKDVRFCGYISSGDPSSPFLCHVFQCTPNAASFTKALEEACRLRLQSCLDTNPELAEKFIPTEAGKNTDKDMNRSGAGIKGFLGKLANQAKLGVPKRSSPEPLLDNATAQQPSSTEYLIKYYGHKPVSVGTGQPAIREAVGVAQESMLQICTISISPDFITLDDSTKSGKLCKYIPLEKISYCGIASDWVHFGLVESQGGGKFICHVFAEYKIPVNKVVETINKVL